MPVWRKPSPHTVLLTFVFTFMCAELNIGFRAHFMAEQDRLERFVVAPNQITNVSPHLKMAYVKWCGIFFFCLSLHFRRYLRMLHSLDGPFLFVCRTAATLFASKSIGILHSSAYLPPSLAILSILQTSIMSAAKPLLCNIRNRPQYTFECPNEWTLKRDDTMAL